LAKVISKSFKHNIKSIVSDSRKIEQLNPEKPRPKAKKSLNKDELSSLAQKVLNELRLGKQASSYKLVQKNLKRLIELILITSK
jgi:hypothetical protein